MLIAILMFIFSKFLPLMFFGQIWSYGLDFFKLTRISWRGKLLYAYYISEVYFFKILFIHIFWAKFGPKIWRNLNWLKLGTGVHCYMLISISMFIFSKFLSAYFFGQFWSQNLKFSKLIWIWWRGTLQYAYYNFDVYFFQKFCHSYNFGQIWSQNLVLSQLPGI